MNLFPKNEHVERLECALAERDAEIKGLRQANEKLSEDLRRANENASREMEFLNEDLSSRERILRGELENEVRKRSVDLSSQLESASKENAVLSTKVDILEKAFQNLGFDVKDMKEILGKRGGYKL